MLVRAPIAQSAVTGAPEAVAGEVSSAIEERLAARRWYVAVVKPQLQYRKIAVDSLRRRDYDVIMPMCRELVVRDRKAVAVDRPMYGRYVFVGAREDQDGWDIRWVPGVQHMTLDARRRPVMVGVPVLSVILARVEADGGVVDLLPRETAPRFVPGQEVVVTEGPFSGWHGLFDADEGKRCRVLLSLFGGQSVVRVSPAGVSEM